MRCATSAFSNGVIESKANELTGVPRARFRFLEVPRFGMACFRPPIPTEIQSVEVNMGVFPVIHDDRFSSWGIHFPTGLGDGAGVDAKDGPCTLSDSQSLRSGETEVKRTRVWRSVSGFLPKTLA